MTLIDFGVTMSKVKVTGAFNVRMVSAHYLESYLSQSLRISNTDWSYRTSVFFCGLQILCFFSKFWHVFISTYFISAAHSLDKRWFKFCDSSYQSLSHITLFYLHVHIRICLSLSPQNCTVITNNYIVCLQTNIMRNNRKVCIFWSTWNDLWKIYPILIP
jgi:hypothetical protein